MISHEIIGDDMQAVILTMAAGDEVRAEAGAMTFMTDGIQMDARLQGGLLGGLKRKFLAGESLFLTFLDCATQTGRVAFSGPYPGKIMRMPLQNSVVLCQRDSFLCASGTLTSTSSSRSVSAQASSVEKGADRIIAARRGDREDVKRDFGGALGALGDIIGGDS